MLICVYCTISLYNLAVSINICETVALIDYRKSLLVLASCIEQLSESGHRWKIVFHQKVL